jgi:hypothetical protein
LARLELGKAKSTQSLSKAVFTRKKSPTLSFNTALYYQEQDSLKGKSVSTTILIIKTISINKPLRHPQQHSLIRIQKGSNPPPPPLLKALLI